MAWGTRHDGAQWDLSEGYLHPGSPTGPTGYDPAPRGHAPSGEPYDDDGAGNASPREVEDVYGSSDEEADDWTFVDSDEARF